jgi:hypothetical protein
MRDAQAFILARVGKMTLMTRRYGLNPKKIDIIYWSSGMTSPAKAVETDPTVKRYEIKYPASNYTFPGESIIHEVRIDDSYIITEFTDGRILSIPLWWIPSVFNASPEERAKFEISRSRTMIIWDPEKGSINDELRIEDYLMPKKAD